MVYIKKKLCATISALLDFSFFLQALLDFSTIYNKIEL